MVGSELITDLKREKTFGHRSLKDIITDNESSMNTYIRGRVDRQGLFPPTYVSLHHNASMFVC